LLTLFDRLLLCANPAEKGRSHEKPTASRVILGRLRAFWAGDWHRLRSEAASHSIGGHSARKQHSLADTARIVDKLASEGDIQRALQLAVRDAKLASGEDLVAKVQSLFPCSSHEVPPPCVAKTSGVASPSPEQAAKVKESIACQILRPPRNRALGRDGSRAEHFWTLRHVQGAPERAAEVLHALALGDLPVQILVAHRGSRVIPLVRADGRIRATLCGSMMRRIALQGVTRAMSPSIRSKLEPWQTGVGMPAGCEYTQKLVAAYLRTSAQPGLLCLDIEKHTIFWSEPQPLRIFVRCCPLSVLMRLLG
jgi:hypothetical protein